MSITVLSDEVRQNTVLMAKLAEQSERYDDMVEHMQKIARTGSLQMDERNLLSVAYKVFLPRSALLLCSRCSLLTLLSLCLFDVRVGT